MFSPVVNEFGTVIYSVADGTRPTTSTGTSVTPAQNAYGSFVTLISGAALTVDCLDILINVNTVGISTTARDCIVALGVDPAGGTSFTSIADLLVGPASQYIPNGNIQGGSWFRFPLWIRAGSSIGVAASVNSATLTAISAFCRVRGQPSHPEQLYVGSYIDQFGVTLASSSGTAITAGTTSEGAYVQLGTLSRPCSAWEFGFGDNFNNTQVALLELDLAIGATSKKIAIANSPIGESALETITKSPSLELAAGATGDGVFARVQSSTTAHAGYSVVAYGIGG